VTYGLYLSAAGAHAQQHRLQVISHNLANVQTVGFKPEEATLQARFAEAIERKEQVPGTKGIDDVGGGVTVAPSSTHFKTGTIRATGVPTDFALGDQEAFFVVQDLDGKSLLTRAGNFLFDGQGRLQTPQGEAVMGADGRGVKINPNLPFEVLEQGRIQQGSDVWTLQVAKPKSLGDVARKGDNYFLPLAPFDNVPVGSRRVVSGHLESSGVEPTTAMVDLIDASRAYEANVRMIQNHDSIQGSLISRVLQG
jgi:flagellar basal-body rod protein FlgF